MNEHTDGDHGRQRFDVLYQTYYPAIYRYLLRRLPTGLATEEAADVAAEVFATAWRKIGAVPETPEDRLWLYGVARRALHRSRRSSSRRDQLSARLQFQAKTTSADDWGEPRPEEIMIAALQRLEPGDREVLYLVSWDGLSNTEAASVLGCSANAVAVRLHRARNRLRAQLGHPVPITEPPPEVAGIEKES